jgi:hypothetical protein
MPVKPQPDYTPESQIKHIPAHALVEMRDPRNRFADSYGVLGLGNNDLITLRLPKFQRGLKWDRDKVSRFHDSLLQGWPIGVMVIAVQSSQLINTETGQREHVLSLIDGQQRVFALTDLMRTFWKEPRIAFANEKWSSASPPSGPVYEAGRAIDSLSSVLNVNKDQLIGWVNRVAQKYERNGFYEFVSFLDRLRDEGADADLLNRPEARRPAHDLCAAVLAQFEALAKVLVPVLVIGEVLQPQLPTIFQRLNEGIPLKGYDLLAAMWDSESAALVRAGAVLTEQQEALLKKVHEIADQRISSTYENVGSGYELDPNTEPVELKDLSLFDYLYYLGRRMLANHGCFKVNPDVLAFQTAALCLRGSIAQVDDRLRESFPRNSDGCPNVEVTSHLFGEAASHVASALKPLMDVTLDNVQLKGYLGLTPTVVYTAVFLTHHNVVRGSVADTTLRTRTNSVEDRMVTGGSYLSATKRVAALKRNLPIWYLLDMLTSAFAGSRAYEHAANRVWHGGTLFTPANVMFEQPALTEVQDALKRLWTTECDVTSTPQRRRVSDLAAVLFRAAYSHATVHDTVIDHVMAFTKARYAANSTGFAYPINHVANLMPLAADINQRRLDAQWADFFPTLTAIEKTQVTETLLIDSAQAKDSHLLTLDTFRNFLVSRYHAMVTKALENLRYEPWMQLDAPSKQAFLEGLTSA